MTPDVHNGSGGPLYDNHNGRKINIEQANLKDPHGVEVKVSLCYVNQETFPIMALLIFSILRVVLVGCLQS